MKAAAGRADLTRRQLATLEFIESYIADKGYPPTMREISDGTGVKSTSTAHFHVRSLVEKGLIEINAESPRTLRVVQ